MFASVAEKHAFSHAREHHEHSGGKNTRRERNPDRAAEKSEREQGIDGGR